ncbi:hypothetical protein NIES4106_26310 [Fischerella sp. NIES-4106]|jgi:hypothetical protein|nr:hypothetical protein NIES4106_26310 [Fischerella sp. NIES-4106]
MTNNRMHLQNNDTKLELEVGYNYLSFFQKNLRNIWQEIINYLVASQELQVKQKIDRHGNHYWQAYDPTTGKSFMSGSESDMLAWIEQLYR